jgi:oxygen-dependent protoporphyrinogen oxidase
MADLDVVVVGAGISGLTATRALCAQGLDVRLFERESACGGVIKTDRVDDFVIDAGPDTLLAHKPAAIALVRELGLSGSLVAPLARRTTYVVRRNVLRTLPETSALGLPTSWHTLFTANAFSWHGKVRMAAEALLPPRPHADGDESISSFVRRRFGNEAVRYVAEPLLAGLHRGDAARLSLHALFPALAEAERRQGSVSRAWRRMPARPGAGTLALRGGMHELVAGMSAHLPRGVAVTGSDVTAIERDDGAFRLHVRDRASLTARAVLLATPAHVTRILAMRLDVDLADLCGGIRYVSAVNVALGYGTDAIRHPLDGWGFVVPAAEGRRVRSVSWVSSKWPGRAPAGSVLIRASLGGPSCPDAVDADDNALIDWAHDDLRDLMGIRESPTLARVYRLPLAMPQIEVGHLHRMAAIDQRLSRLPGVFVAASGFRGVGLPDCIQDAHAVAGRIASYLGVRGDDN